MKKPVMTISALLLTGLLSACSSVSLPKVDFDTSPEFQEEAENVGDYPNVAEAPVTPTDVRSDKAWDDAARALIAARADFEAPSSGETPKTDAQTRAEMEALRAKVHEYKLDDPE